MKPLVNKKTLKINKNEAYIVFKLEFEVTNSSFGRHYVLKSIDFKYKKKNMWAHWVLRYKQWIMHLEIRINYHK